MTDRRRPLRALAAALLLVGLSLSIAACGSSSEEKTGLMEGEPVTLGDLQYNVVFSRFLNPHDVEDHEYLVGQPPPPADAAYFGVFVQIINKSHDRERVDPLRVQGRRHRGPGVHLAGERQHLRAAARWLDRPRGHRPGARLLAAGRPDRRLPGPVRDPGRSRGEPPAAVRDHGDRWPRQHRPRHLSGPCGSASPLPGSGRSSSSSTSSGSPAGSPAWGRWSPGSSSLRPTPPPAARPGAGGRCSPPERSSPWLGIAVSFAVASLGGLLAVCGGILVAIAVVLGFPGS